MEEKKEEKKTKYLEARLAANRRYYAKNKEKMQLTNLYSQSKMFINRTEDITKLEEIIELCNKKIETLKKGTD